MSTTTTAITGADLHAVIKPLCQPGERLYGIVDSARDLELASAAWARYDLKRWWLFDHNTDPQMNDVAPYLVDLQYRPTYPYPGSGYLDMWAAHLGNSSGILLLTDVHQRTLWEHLNRMFRVRDQQGNNYFFRYYDPRVSRIFLPTCSKEQALDFFGPMRAFLIESEPPDYMLMCGCGQSGVHLDEIPLRTSRSDFSIRSLDS